MVQSLDLLILLCLLLLQLLLLLLLQLTRLFVLADVLLKVQLVVLELFLGVKQGLVSPLLPLLELFDFLLDCVVGELSQEHFFLLVDKLVRVLRSLLLRELDAAASDVHRFVNLFLLLS